MNCDNVKIGLALGGGFFRGIAHIGVLQVLAENKIPISMVAGTSIGSAVGAAYAAGADPFMLGKLVCACSENMFYDVGMPRMGLIKGEKIVAFMRTITGNKSFEQTKIPFAAVACDIERGEKVVLSQGNLAQAVRASVSVPGVFRPVEYEGRLLVDGGVMERLPVSVVRDMGADVTIAVDVGARTGSYSVRNTVDVMMRALELMEYQVIASETPPDVLLHPELHHITMTSLSQAQECLERGRGEATYHLPEIFAAIEAVQRKKEAG
jgi:NTE family protein